MRLRDRHRAGIADLHPQTIRNQAEQATAFGRGEPDSAQRKYSLGNIVGQPWIDDLHAERMKGRLGGVSPAGQGARPASRKKSPGVSKPSVRALGTTVTSASMRAGS